MIIKDFAGSSQFGREDKKMNKIDRLATSTYNFCTDSQQEMWKRSKHRVFLGLCSMVLILVLLVSCGTFKGKKEVPPTGEDKMISMTREEVVKAMGGQPDVVSREPNGRIVWTYRPGWKIMPDNKGTVYVEFEGDRVVKVIRAR